MLLIDVCAFGYVTKEWEVLPGGISREIKAGPPYYVCVALLSLGDSVRLVTRVAKEDAEILQDIISFGGEVVNLPTRNTMKSRIIYLDKSLSERKLEVLSLADPFEVNDLNYCEGMGAKYVYLGPLTTRDFTLEFIKKASEIGNVVLDVQGFTRKVVGMHIAYVDWSWKDEALPYIKVLKMDEKEGVLITRESLPERMIKALFSKGLEEVILTTDRGVYLGSSNKGIYFSSFLTNKVIGRTGRGDTAVAAYIHSKLRGWNLQFSAKFVSATTSLKLMNEGPFKGSEKDVFNFMRNI